MLTAWQSYLMQVMDQLRYLRRDQLFRFSFLRFGSREEQFDRDVRQLCYLNKLAEKEGYLFQPGRRRDDDVIAAVDIMFQFAGGEMPEFAAGHGACKLAFFLTGANGRVSAFKVYPVHLGQEAQVSAQADADRGRIHTVLFQIEDRKQLELVYTEHPYHFVIWEDGRYVFLKGA